MYNGSEVKGLLVCVNTNSVAKRLPMPQSAQYIQSGSMQTLKASRSREQVTYKTNLSGFIWVQSSYWGWKEHRAVSLSEGSASSPVKHRQTTGLSRPMFPSRPLPSFPTQKLHSPCNRSSRS